MCGITGWVDWDADLRQQRPVAQAMTDTMACRGPDAEGLWLSERAALGHRRLAVIDLEGGVQPMTADRGAGSDIDKRGAEVVLTYCGEVYNFRQLRQELNVYSTEPRTEAHPVGVTQSRAAGTSHSSGVRLFRIAVP